MSINVLSTSNSIVNEIINKCTSLDINDNKNITTCNILSTIGTSNINPKLYSSNIYLENFNYLIHGGYANIYYNSNTSTILKIQPLYEENNYLCSSTLYETIMFNTLLHIPNSCHIKNIKVNDSSIYHYMPYYGIPLHQFITMKNFNIKFLILPTILSIVEKCILLYERDIQHTDLKPNNIIINKLTKKVTLIDYNICSIRSSGKTKFGWSYGIGTWCYCSPEIIYHDEPSDTSMVWSIGLLLAYMYSGHPLTNRYKNIYDYTEQNDWKTIYKSLKSKYSNGLPLSKEHKDLMPMRVQYIFSSCTHWDWQKRPTIHELYELLFKIIYNDISYTIKPTQISYNINNGYIYIPGVKLLQVYKNKDQRNKAYNTIWTLSKITKRYDLLCKTLILIDKYPNELTEYAIIGCLCISYILSGSLLSDNTFTFEIYKFFNITVTILNNIILDTLKLFNWDCYTESADTLVIDSIIAYMYNKNKYITKYIDKIKYIDKLYNQYSFYKSLYLIMLSLDNEYNMNYIVELLFKEIIAQNLI